ncbi:hypothetical protein COV93_03950, partial [Candidatus Woesearchaeota archaeon CG11_big_fil_rev_8_21_14_0_20_43_8]
GSKDIQERLIDFKTGVTHEAMHGYIEFFLNREFLETLVDVYETPYASFKDAKPAFLAAYPTYKLFYDGFDDRLDSMGITSQTQRQQKKDAYIAEEILVNYYTVKYRTGIDGTDAAILLDPKIKAFIDAFEKYANKNGNEMPRVAAKALEFFNLAKPKETFEVSLGTAIKLKRLTGRTANEIMDNGYAAAIGRLNLDGMQAPKLQIIEKVPEIKEDGGSYSLSLVPKDTVVEESKYNSIEYYEDLVKRKYLDSAQELKGSMDNAINALAAEGNAKLVDGVVQGNGIITLKDQNFRTIIVPDLHARRNMLLQILKQTNDEGKTNFELLKEGKVNIILLGDGMHAEGRAEYRWEQAAIDIVKNDDYSKVNAEMVESLNMMKMIMDLKATFPDSFHYIRGNHDELEGGFRKYGSYYMGEAMMVLGWMEEKFGDDFIQDYKRFEGSLPLMAIGNNFVASHAGPMTESAQSALTYPTDWISGIKEKDPAVIHGLTWTDNSEIDDDLVEMTLDKFDAEYWVIGHRPVNQDNGGIYNNYKLIGSLVQINDPNYMVYMNIPTTGILDTNGIKNIGLNDEMMPDSIKDNDLFEPTTTSSPEIIALGQLGSENPKIFTMAQLKKGITIGRDPNNDIIVLDPKAALEHAKISIDNSGHIYIDDLSSNKISDLIGNKVSKTILHNGDVFGIADTIMEVFGINSEISSDDIISSIAEVAFGEKVDMDRHDMIDILNEIAYQSELDPEILHNIENYISGATTGVAQMSFSNQLLGTVTIEQSNYLIYSNRGLYERAAMLLNAILERSMKIENHNDEYSYAKAYTEFADAIDKSSHKDEILQLITNVLTLRPDQVTDLKNSELADDEAIKRFYDHARSYDFNMMKDWISKYPRSISLSKESGNQITITDSGFDENNKDYTKYSNQAFARWAYEMIGIISGIKTIYSPDIVNGMNIARVNRFDDKSESAEIEFDVDALKALPEIETDLNDQLYETFIHELYHIYVDYDLEGNSFLTELAKMQEFKDAKRDMTDYKGTDIEIAEEMIIKYYSAMKRNENTDTRSRFVVTPNIINFIIEFEKFAGEAIGEDGIDARFFLDFMNDQDPLKQLELFMGINIKGLGASTAREIFGRTIIDNTAQRKAVIQSTKDEAKTLTALTPEKTLTVEEAMKFRALGNIISRLWMIASLEDGKIVLSVKNNANTMTLDAGEIPRAAYAAVKGPYQDNIIIITNKKMHIFSQENGYVTSGDLLQKPEDQMLRDLYYNGRLREVGLTRLFDDTGSKLDNKNIITRHPNGDISFKAVNIKNKENQYRMTPAAGLMTDILSKDEGNKIMAELRKEQDAIAEATDYLLDDTVDLGPDDLIDITDDQIEVVESVTVLIPNLADVTAKDTDNQVTSIGSNMYDTPISSSDGLTAVAGYEYNAVIASVQTPEQELDELIRTKLINNIDTRIMPPQQVIDLREQSTDDSMVEVIPLNNPKIRGKLQADLITIPRESFVDTDQIHLLTKQKAILLTKQKPVLFTKAKTPERIIIPMAYQDTDPFAIIQETREAAIDQKLEYVKRDGFEVWIKKQDYKTEITIKNKNGVTTTQVLGVGEKIRDVYIAKNGVREDNLIIGTVYSDKTSTYFKTYAFSETVVKTGQIAIPLTAGIVEYNRNYASLIVREMYQKGLLREKKFDDGSTALGYQQYLIGFLESDNTFKFDEKAEIDVLPSGNVRLKVRSNTQLGQIDITPTGTVTDLTLLPFADTVSAKIRENALAKQIEEEIMLDAEDLEDYVDDSYGEFNPLLSNQIIELSADDIIEEPLSGVDIAEESQQLVMELIDISPPVKEGSVISKDAQSKRKVLEKKLSEQRDYLGSTLDKSKRIQQALNFVELLNIGTLEDPEAVAKYLPEPPTPGEHNWEMSYSQATFVSDAIDNYETVTGASVSWKVREMTIMTALLMNSGSFYLDESDFQQLAMTETDRAIKFIKKYQKELDLTDHETMLVSYMLRVSDTKTDTKSIVDSADLITKPVSQWPANQLYMMKTLFSVQDIKKFDNIDSSLVKDIGVMARIVASSKAMTYHESYIRNLDGLYDEKDTYRVIMNSVLMGLQNDRLAAKRDGKPYEREAFFKLAIDLFDKMMKTYPKEIKDLILQEYNQQVQQAARVKALNVEKYVDKRFTDQWKENQAMLAVYYKVLNHETLDSAELSLLSKMVSLGLPMAQELSAEYQKYRLMDRIMVNINGAMKVLFGMGKEQGQCTG